MNTIAEIVAHMRDVDPEATEEERLVLTTLADAIERAHNTEVAELSIVMSRTTWILVAAAGGTLNVPADVIARCGPGCVVERNFSDDGGSFYTAHNTLPRKALNG